MPALAKSDAKNTGSVERMLALLDEFEQGRQTAIDDLLSAREDINAKLQRLGYSDQSKPGPIRTAEPKKKRSCGVCGSLEHNSRFHKKADAGNPAPATPTA